MLSSILYCFFKFVRKAGEWVQAFINQYKIGYYFYISKKRFIIAKSVIIGKRFLINSDLSNTTIIIKNNCRIRDNFNITMGDNSKLCIGENCFFNNNCSINCLGEIEIGNNNQFGEVFLMYDHNHAYSSSKKLVSDQGYNVGTIKIGNNCWIGSNVVILKDVVIGDNVVIGAGCVIYKSISNNSVVINRQNLSINQY